MLAEKHLRKLNYEILERKWRASHAEIDLIAMEVDILIFVEVKTRHLGKHEVEQSVRKRQRSRMAYAAGVYMAEIGHDWEIRFDLIEIEYYDREHFTLRHTPDFFYPTRNFHE